MAKSKYESLLQPGQIGSVRIKNRMVRMAAFPGFPKYEGGYLQQYYADFWTAIAKGGVGLVGCSLAPAPGEAWSLDKDEYIPRALEMNERIHSYGTATYVQLFHVGPYLPAPDTVAASVIPPEEMPVVGLVKPAVRALTTEEVKALIKRYGEVAARARRAGFDMVEINAGCNHLFATFLSRVWNRRDDEYGPDSLENRARIVTELLREIKAQAGADFPVIVLYNGAEPGVPNGITVDEAKEFARIFEAAGADAIHVRAEMYLLRRSPEDSDSTHFPDVAFFPEIPEVAKKSGADTSKHGAGAWVPFAVDVKKVVSVPVIATGRLDADLGAKLVSAGMVDFINLNRRSIADHDYANKVAEGRLEDIAPCTACMTCFDRSEHKLELRCRINAAAGREREFELVPATTSKKVVVVGGGPAGLEAARVAALRGHRVTLLEREPMLGGAMNLAAVVKGIERENLLELVDYFKRQLDKLGVDIRTSTEATAEVVSKLEPHVVIVAAGAGHAIPDIPGIDSKKVLTSKELHSRLKNYLRLTGARLMTKLATKYVPVGKTVVIIGGGIQGCETAEFLTKRGRKVTIVEPGPELGEGLLETFIRPFLLKWLRDKGVLMLAGVKCEEITKEGLVITTAEGERRLLEADTIITALPLRANPAVYEELKGVAPEVYAIGDCNEPGLIVDAVAAGSTIARAI